MIIRFKLENSRYIRRGFTKLFSVLALILLTFVAAYATEKSNDDLNNKLMKAADSGNVAVVKKVLARGADPNYMVNMGHKVTSGGYTVLMTAAHQGKVQVVKVLLSHGAKVNLSDDSGLTALHEASMEGYYDIVDLLIKAGADVNSRTTNGETAISMASLNKYTKIVNLLQKHGAK